MTDKIHEPRQGQADKILSTFWWEMHLDKRNPVNTIEKLTGYSKFQNHDEAKDKKQMLMRKIIMFQSRGYLQRSNRIEIFQRMGKFIDKSSDLLIITMKPDDVSVHERVMQDFQMTTFLEKLYECIRTGNDVQSLLPKADPKFSKDEYLDINIQHSRIGNSGEKLSAYCSRLIRNGHPFGAANHFFNSYTSKFLNHD